MFLRFGRRLASERIFHPLGAGLTMFNCVHMENPFSKLKGVKFSLGFALKPRSAPVGVPGGSRPDLKPHATATPQSLRVKNPHEGSSAVAARF
ncbi:hypothetical protein JTE90_001832 [Oedothorax gibbosus]|uniref:Uncharacterized protein n=1 Tax=Oedothorax gibbosus TaxID=931172 RepID=A0AAV6THM7_9ARAC|nr:hypothetical protein JTE90_001832 [Oedothorax gibbosus]